MSDFKEGDRVRIWTPNAGGHMDVNSGEQAHLHKKLGTVVEPLIGGLMLLGSKPQFDSLIGIQIDGMDDDKLAVLPTDNMVKHFELPTEDEFPVWECWTSGPSEYDDFLIVGRKFDLAVWLSNAVDDLGHHDHIHVCQHLSTEYEGSSYTSGSAAARPRRKSEVTSDAE